MPQNIVLLPTGEKTKPVIPMYGSLVVLRCLENSLVRKTGYRKNGETRNGATRRAQIVIVII